MKKFMCISIAIICCIILGACRTIEDHTGKAKTPSSSSAMNGRNYKSVVESFEDNGFTNIKLEKIEDLITGWFTEEGEVEDVSVGGDFDYSSDKWVDADTEVVIRYHAFPKSEKETELTKPKTDKNTNQEAKLDEILTIDNSEELSNMLLDRTDSYELYSSFASKYQGRTIEFDGYVADLMKHKDYNTIYDILIYVGDSSDEYIGGPTLKFENVNYYNLGLDTLNLESEIEVGKNIRIVAKVDKFDNSSGLFFLNPVSVTER